MQNRSSKAQKDTQQLARQVLDAIVPDAGPKKPKALTPEESQWEGEGGAPKAKNPAAVALGRLGGLKGGAARAKTLSKAKRSEIAKKAAAARWKSKPS